MEFEKQKKVLLELCYQKDFPQTNKQKMTYGSLGAYKNIQKHIHIIMKVLEVVLKEEVVFIL